VPFTFAHPAAVLPLRRHGSLSALVIGSMAPDLGFILPFTVSRELTHGMAGLLLFNLPGGVLTFLLFHLLLKPAVLALLPERLQEKLVLPAKAVNASWLSVCISLLCGALTHIAWDSFTHQGTATVNALPPLQVLLATVGGYRLYVYKLLQFASSVAGMALLAWCFMRWLRSAPRAALPQAVLAWPVRAACVAAIVGVAALAALSAGMRHDAAVTDLATLRPLAGACHPAL
jgi:hypothetical protein